MHSTEHGSEDNLLKALEYPFDVGTILTKKAALRGLLSRKENISKRIAILGESTTSEVVQMLELFLLKAGINPVFFESDYGQGRQCILSDDPALKDFAPELVYFHTNIRNIRRWPSLGAKHQDPESMAEQELNSYRVAWNKVQKNFNCHVIQNNFEHPNVRVLGNLDGTHSYGNVNYVRRLNQKFAEFAQTTPQFFINDLNYQSSVIGLDKWFDDPLWYRSKYAVSFNAITMICHNLSRIMASVWGLSKRCMVVDLDNTLWGGVVGEEGHQALQLGPETPKGEAFADFQTFVKNIKSIGISLAIASKNYETSAKDGFDHPHSVLRWDDFAARQANWDPKVDSIREISKRIGLGLGSLVFIDDNPAERAIVQQHLPEVATPDVGSSVINFSRVIDRSGFFETADLIAEDLERNKYYQENLQREELQLQFDSYLSYLKSLEMTAQIVLFNAKNLQRIFQLTNKTNQFNLTTYRYSMAEIQKFSEEKKYISLSGQLSDKFGDNGLVSLIIGRIEQDVCHIDLLLMSCRVLKRQMEFALLDTLVKYCEQRRVSEIHGHFIPTERNMIVKDFYQSAGFQLHSQSEHKTSWKIATADYRKLNESIEVIDGL